MKLEIFPQEFSVCKINPGTPLPQGLVFFAHTDSENSLVCETAHLPSKTESCENGWRMFRVAGSLEFSLLGILARITSILAEAGVSVFCVSTYDTDYILVKSTSLEKAVQALSENDYTIAYL